VSFIIKTLNQVFGIFEEEKSYIFHLHILSLLTCDLFVIFTGPAGAAGAPPGQPPQQSYGEYSSNTVSCSIKTLLWYLIISG